MSARTPKKQPPITHTTLPWWSRGNRIYSGAGFDAKSASREIAVATKSDPEFRHQADANADLITLACNAHYSLVAACEDAAFIIRGGDKDEDLEPWALGLCQKLEAALALAKASK